MPPTFADVGVPADLVGLLSRRGVTQPFPVQAATLPDALAGRDVCGCAPTGSGKTLAFGLALALRTGKAQPRRPRALVLVPTRELCAQVSLEVRPLAGARGRTVAAVYGGTGYEAQRRALRQAVDVLVATPGRLEDLVARGDARLDAVDVVVVDEADRMADMGFLPAVRRLLDATRPDRQTLLFSATLDGDVDVLVRRYQRDPRRHDVAPEPTAVDVEHLFWDAERAQRVALTVELVEHHRRAIVFCRTRHGADRLTGQLSKAGVKAVVIHGSRTQGQRDRALAAFTDGRATTLVATDVAARGIHVDSVPCVVHFDPPGDHKDYVHRSGRTGRAGAGGTVVSLVGPEHRSAVRAIQRALGLPQGTDPRGARDGAIERSPAARAEPNRRPAAAAPVAPRRMGEPGAGRRRPTRARGCGDQPGRPRQGRQGPSAPSRRRRPR
ncbi:MAG: DEAD/DEAH box helicase [Acidimicrobiales bacterium]